MIINCIPTDPTSRIAPQDYYHQLTNTPSIDPLRDTYLQCLFGTAAIISNHPGLSMFGDLRTRNAKEDFKCTLHSTGYSLSGRLDRLITVSDEEVNANKSAILRFLGLSWFNSSVEQKVINQRLANIGSTHKLLEVAVNSFTLIASNLDSPTNLFAHYMSISNASSLVNGAHHPDLAFNIIATFTR